MFIGGFKDTKKLLEKEKRRIDRKIEFQKTKKWLYPTVGGVIILGMGTWIYKNERAHANSILPFADISLPSIKELPTQI